MINCYLDMLIMVRTSASLVHSHHSYRGDPGTMVAAQRLGRASLAHREPANDVRAFPVEGATPMLTIARFRCVEQVYRRPSGMEGIV